MHDTDDVIDDWFINFAKWWEALPSQTMNAFCWGKYIPFLIWLFKYYLFFALIFVLTGGDDENCELTNDCARSSI